jgi:hypothetical protein
LKIEQLSPRAQEGLRQWALWMHGDELLFDHIASSPTEWAWISYQLWMAEDRPEWFPKGKSATIQVIQMDLYEEAKQLQPVKRI